MRLQPHFQRGSSETCLRVSAIKIPEYSALLTSYKWQVADGKAAEKLGVFLLAGLRQLRNCDRYGARKMRLRLFRFVPCRRDSGYRPWPGDYPGRLRPICDVCTKSSVPGRLMLSIGQCKRTKPQATQNSKASRPGKVSHHSSSRQKIENVRDTGLCQFCDIDCG